MTPRRMTAPEFPPVVIITEQPLLLPTESPKFAVPLNVPNYASSPNGNSNFSETSLTFISPGNSNSNTTMVNSHSYNSDNRRRSSSNNSVQIPPINLHRASESTAASSSLQPSTRMQRSKSNPLVETFKWMFKSETTKDEQQPLPKTPSYGAKTPKTPTIATSKAQKTRNRLSSPTPLSTHSLLPPLKSKRLTPPPLGSHTPKSSSRSSSPTPSLTRSRSNPMVDDSGNPLVSTRSILLNDEIRERRKSDTYVQQAFSSFFAGKQLQRNPDSSSSLLTPHTNRSNIGAVLSWSEVGTDGTKVWKQQSMAKTPTSTAVAVERVSSVVKQEVFKPTSPEPGTIEAKPLCMESFQLVKKIGQGGYGEVHLARKIDTYEIVALKAMEKVHISRKNKVLNIRNERNALAQINDQSWIVQLLYAFQDEFKVYLAMEFLPGGDLRGLLRTLGALEEDDLRTYGAEMLMAVNEVHQLGFIHRDLKPENFLVDKHGHLKIADLGISTSGASAFEDLKIKIKAIHRGSVISSELVLNDGKTKLKRNQSIVGSPAYMAPEMLERTGYGPEVDSWSLGCMFYEMLTGRNPFEGTSPQEAFANVLRWREVLANLEASTEEQLSKHAWDLIKKFLCDPKDRLLRNGISSVMAHPFFEGVDWTRLRSRTPPFVPKLDSETDTSYFPFTRDDAFGDIPPVNTEDFDIEPPSVVNRFGNNNEVSYTNVGNFRDDVLSTNTREDTTVCDFSGSPPDGFAIDRTHHGAEERTTGDTTEQLHNNNSSLRITPNSYYPHSLSPLSSSFSSSPLPIPRHLLQNSLGHSTSSNNSSFANSQYEASISSLDHTIHSYSLSGSTPHSQQSHNDSQYTVNTYNLPRLESVNDMYDWNATGSMYSLESSRKQNLLFSMENVDTSTTHSANQSLVNSLSNSLPHPMQNSLKEQQQQQQNLHLPINVNQLTGSATSPSTSRRAPLTPQKSKNGSMTNLSPIRSHLASTPPPSFSPNSGSKSPDASRKIQISGFDFVRSGEQGRSPDKDKDRDK